MLRHTATTLNIFVFDEIKVSDAYRKEAEILDCVEFVVSNFVMSKQLEEGARYFARPPTVAGDFLIRAEATTF